MTCAHTAAPAHRPEKIVQWGWNQAPLAELVLTA